MKNTTTLLYFSFLVATQLTLAPRCGALTVNHKSTSPSARHLGVLPNLQPSCRLKKFPRPLPGISSDCEHAINENIDKDIIRSSLREKTFNKKSALMQSIGIIPAFRRLTFLFLSVVLVQTFRSVVLKVSHLNPKWSNKPLNHHFSHLPEIYFSSYVLVVAKIPKSDKKFFDECPWPFTFFHDPIKAAKDSPTWVVIVWAVACQIYSHFEKSKSFGGLPPITMV